MGVDFVLLFGVLFAIAGVIVSVWGFKKQLDADREE
jgi:hypothetical protein